MGKSSVNPNEILKFAQLSKDWWNPKGTSAMLHLMNPIRLKYIRKHSEMLLHTSMEEMRVLDVGCGAGLLSEAMARCGAKVLAIDAAKENVAAACSHLKQDLLLQESNRLQYIHSSSEDLRNTKEFKDWVHKTKEGQFDVITALEVIEHVHDPDFFLSSTLSHLKPGGLFFISTINRTALSYAMAIVIGESPLIGVPPGTHDWNCFWRPEELVDRLRRSRMEVLDVSGMLFNPFTWSWSNSNRLDCNYIICAKNI